MSSSEVRPIMDEGLPVGQRVLVRKGVEKYGGLPGRVIHREWVTGERVYQRVHRHAKTGQGRLAVVVELEDPPSGFEPVILCYEEHLSPLADG